jgi:predicted transcriptional regulator of viral defense system
LSASTPIVQALAVELERLRVPVLLRYDLARLSWTLYRAGTHGGQPLNIRRDSLDIRAFRRIENTILNSGLVKTLPGFPESSAYATFGANLNDHQAVLCSLDPFSYLSHLSAMEFHGLTDRMPEQIYATSPPGRQWTVSALERMRKDLGDEVGPYRQSGLPPLQRLSFDRIGQRRVYRYSSLHVGAYRTIQDSPVRVATLGRTFLDMLREPGLCGGITHVLQVFQEHAPKYKRLIFDEFDQHGGAIDKVRAGYILETLCSLQDPRIDAWVQFAARGGSRRLDPAAEYAPRFSERWCLSINVAIEEEGP